jgi:transcriptional regulator PpsR
MDQTLPGPVALDALAKHAAELAATLVALTGDIALVIDADGAVRQVVQGTDPLAPAATQWVGRPWSETVSDDSRRKIEQLLGDVRSHGSGRTREVNLAAGGSTIPVAYAALRLGETGPVIAVGRDLRAIAAIQQRFVESQQEMERDYWKRRQAESRYRMLFQVATDAVIVVDALTMTIVDANRAAGQMFGMTQADLLGKHATVGIERHSWLIVEQLLTAARTTGRPVEVRARLASPGAAPIDVSATPFRSERDLLLLVRARATAQASAPGEAVSSAQWTDLVRRIPDGVVITDASGRVLAANPAFVALCQLVDESDAEGEMLSRWLGADTVIQLLSRSGARGMLSPTTATLVGNRARTLHVSVTGALLDDGDIGRVGFTLRPLDDGDDAEPEIDEVANAIDALTGLMGRQALPDLLHTATLMAERHLIRTACRRAGGELHAASVMLGITEGMLAQRLAAHALRPNGDREERAQMQPS